MKNKLLGMVAYAVLASIPLAAASYPSADRDIYGNTIYTNEQGAVTYQFLVSGDLQDSLSVSNSAFLASNADVALDALFKSVRKTEGGALRSTKIGAIFTLR